VEYRVVRNLKPRDAAYIAGLVDGEGTVTLTALHRGEQRRLVLSISNNDKALLEYVKTSAGVGCIASKRCRSERHAIGYAYKVANRQAFDLLVQLAPYLRTYRRDRALLVLRWYRQLTPRNGRYTSELLERRSLFIKEFLAMGPGPRGAARGLGGSDT
jgi:hypothetical protein